MVVLTVLAVSAVMAVSGMTAPPLKLNPPPLFFFRDPDFWHLPIFSRYLLPPLRLFLNLNNLKRLLPKGPRGTKNTTGSKSLPR